MQQPKQGDVVKFSAYGRTVNAIVLAAHYGEVSHHGKQGEPLLDLIYIDPERESAIEKKQIGWHPRVFTEFSVVHQSHEFSADYKRQKGIATQAQVVAQRGAGEWAEIASEEIASEGPEFLARLRAGELDDAETQTGAGKAIELLKGPSGSTVKPGEGNWGGGQSADEGELGFEVVLGRQTGVPGKLQTPVLAEIVSAAHYGDIPAKLFSPSGAQEALGTPDEGGPRDPQGSSMAEITPEDIAAFNAATGASVVNDTAVGEKRQKELADTEGFTLVKGSSAIAAYKYNEADRSFEVITAQGLRYKHENVSPETAQAFELASSKGVAWNRLIKNPAAQL